MPDVLRDGFGQGILRLRLLGQIDRRADRVDQHGEMARQDGIGLHDVDRRPDGPAIGMAQHEDQRSSQHLHAVFEAAEAVGVDEVAGDADDEQVAGTLIEDIVRRDPRIGAADDAGDRVLR